MQVRVLYGSHWSRISHRGTVESLVLVKSLIQSHDSLWSAHDSLWSAQQYLVRTWQYLVRTWQYLLQSHDNLYSSHMTLCSSHMTISAPVTKQSCYKSLPAQSHDVTPCETHRRRNGSNPNPVMDMVRVSIVSRTLIDTGFGVLCMHKQDAQTRRLSMYHYTRAGLCSTNKRVFLTNSALQCRAEWWWVIWWRTKRTDWEGLKVIGTEWGLWNRILDM